MPRILRLNDTNGDPIRSAGSRESVDRFLEDPPPGRYHIDEISSDPLPLSHTSRRWGFGFKWVAIDCDPWDA